MSNFNALQDQLESINSSGGEVFKNKLRQEDERNEYS
jgi:hypothetical protein